MRAETLVSLMLEATPNGAVLAFGYGAPATGFYGNRLDDVVTNFKQLNLVSKDAPTLQAVNDLIQQQNAAFVIQKNPNDIHVYSRSTPLALDREGKERIQTLFGVNTDSSSVAWSRDFGTTAQQKPANEVFGTVKERQQRELDKQHQLQRELVTRAAGAAPPTGGTQPAPNPGGGGYQPRVKLGFDYDTGSTDGIRIVKVTPNSPASRAGLVAGDVLYTVGPYTSSLSPQGQASHYRLKTADDLKHVLGELDPDVPVPLGVLRGDGSMKLAMVPEKQ
jgi:hypothetical protein